MAEYDKGSDFEKFMLDRNINMIVLSNVLKRDNRFKNDSEWLNFLKNYVAVGYVKMVIPNTDRELIAKRSLFDK